MSKFAITPRGVGNRVGARRIKDDWPLEDGEAFTVDGNTDVENMVLAADTVSLAPAPKSKPLNIDEKIAARRNADPILDALLKAHPEFVADIKANMEQ